MMEPLDISQIEAARSACSFELRLRFKGLGLLVMADNQAILDTLETYYAGLTSDEEPEASLTVYLVDRTIDTGNQDWVPIERAKVSPLGLKEAYKDTEDGRWIHKVRTGMVMFQSLTSPTVCGDLQKHASQVVNFINNQFLNHKQQEGFLLGHASAFSVDGLTTAIAASSGGGKSTLMLRALESPQTRFLSNDRILFKPTGSEVEVLGVAKHPRVNPGTLIHSERLQSILPEPERRKFETLPQAELWNIEQKYDVPIDRMYGPGKAQLSGRLRHLVLLDWSLNIPESTRLTRVDIEQTPGALDGLRKSAGPFFQNATGEFPGENTPPASVYAAHLPGVQVWQLSGLVDFDRAIELFSEEGLLG